MRVIKGIHFNQVPLLSDVSGSSEPNTPVKLMTVCLLTLNYIAVPPPALSSPERQRQKRILFWFWFGFGSDSHPIIPLIEAPLMRTCPNVLKTESVNESWVSGT